ncbi:MAG: Mur ligase family protein [Candidatus Latescibacterota bacterium]
MKSNHQPFPDILTPLPSNLEFIFNLSPSVMTLGLANMQALLSRLDKPQNKFPSIIVAGTNGKGSVSCYISSLLNANGLKVGRYTSPHIYSVTERISIGEEYITLEQMEKHASRIVPLHAIVPFSYFEAITAIAFLEFAEKEVDYAVLEVGLGGRFDATNVSQAAVTIITSISLDHRRVLGDTEVEILREKLGIARKGVALLIGNLSAELLGIIERRQAQDGFDLHSLQNIGSVKREGLSPAESRIAIRTARQNYGTVSLPFAGEHQSDNALLALGAVECVLDEVKNVPQAFASAYMPGRFERLECMGKTVILDVAHNDAALSRLAETYSQRFRAEDSAIVLGAMRRKELSVSLARLMAAARRLYLIAPETGESSTPHELFDKLNAEFTFTDKKDIILWNGQDVSSGWDRLVDVLFHPASEFANILVTGSHRTVESFGRRLLLRGML